jgi:hypothetical protein
MFKKKQIPAEPRRNSGESIQPGVFSRRSVNPSANMNVFSYHAKRAPVSESNPQYANSRNDGSGFKNVIGKLPSFIAVAVLILCLLYISTLSATPKIQVVGQTTDRTLVRDIGSYEDDIRAVFASAVINRSKLLIDSDAVAGDVQQEYPELGEVSVILPLVSRRTIVQVRPAAPTLILSTSSGAYVIDTEGRAVIKSAEVESSVRDKLPVVRDESSLPVEEGKTVLPKETIAFITSISSQLAAKGMPVQSLVLPSTANELHLRIPDKPYFVKFDVRGEGRQSIGTYLAVKSWLEKENKAPNEYIDVRVPEKAFYR